MRNGVTQQEVQAEEIKRQEIITEGRIGEEGRRGEEILKESFDEKTFDEEANAEVRFACCEAEDGAAVEATG